MVETVSSYDDLLKRIKTRLAGTEPPFLIAIAGPPATGKSTLAERIVSDLNAAGPSACYCPMDGFHLTNAQLDQAGLRDVKGRIDTFDSARYAEAIMRLKEARSFWWPRYSRQRHDPIPEGTHITGTESVFVIEGNYVLANSEPWCSATRMFDLRIFVDTPDAILRERLLARHQRSGRSDQVAQEKISQTDIPNARAIRDNRENIDILLSECTDA